MVELARDAEHPLAERPEDVLGEDALLEGHVAEVEESEALVLVLEGVVVGLEEVLARGLAVGVVEVPHDRVHVERDLVRDLGDELVDAEDVHDEHGVVRGDGAARLAHDDRVRHVVGVADLHDAVDHVVRVLLRRVVHRALEVRLGAVVVDAEAAAHVEVPERRARLVELDVEARRLAERVLQAADGRDLGAQVEVEELEAADEPRLLHHLHRLEHLAGGEAELGAVAARALPSPRAARRELGAHADLRLDPRLLGDLLYELELARLLDDEDDVPAELGGEERRLDVLLVLVAVADDQGLFIIEHRHDREELGLGPGLETVVVLAARLDDLLDDGPVLVDLDRVDALVGALVAVVRDRAAEALVQELDARAEDVVEAEEEGRGDPAAHELVHELLEVDLALALAGRRDRHVPALVDREVRETPVADAVELGRVGGRPPLQDIRGNLQFSGPPRAPIG